MQQSTYNILHSTENYTTVAGGDSSIWKPGDNSTAAISCNENGYFNATGHFYATFYIQPTAHCCKLLNTVLSSGRW